MPKTMLAVLSLAALALAGCSGDDDAHTAFADFTCPDGAIITAAQQEADAQHHEATFDPASLCPVPPVVKLEGLPTTLGAFRNAPFTWVVDAGSVAHGHSMLTSIRYGTASVPAPAAMTDYSTEVIKREHQDLPVTFKGNLTFTQAGTVYLRAYAQVQGENYARRDVWSQEITLQILPVEPTGTVHTVTHGAGLLLGEVTPSEPVDALLGDAVQFDNRDVVAHTLTQQSGPSGHDCAEITAAEQATSATCVLNVPGTYEWRTDGQQPKTVTIKVAVPA